MEVDGELIGELPPLEDGLAGEVVASDHQAVDGRQLLQGQRGEERHLLQRDQVIHAFARPLLHRLRRLPDPSVGMPCEHRHFGFRERPRHAALEGVGFEKPDQRLHQPGRAEV